MEELDKLRHLLEHWIEHNEEHVKTYLQWAERADAHKQEELAEVLRQIASETKKLEELFKKAKGVMVN